MTEAQPDGGMKRGTPDAGDTISKLMKAKRVQDREGDRTPWVKLLMRGIGKQSFEIIASVSFIALETSLDILLGFHLPIYFIPLSRYRFSEPDFVPEYLENSI